MGWSKNNIVGHCNILWTALMGERERIVKEKEYHCSGSNGYGGIAS